MESNAVAMTKTHAEILEETMGFIAAKDDASTKAAESIARWNVECPAGTWVRHYRDSWRRGDWVAEKVASRAFLDTDGRPVVRLSDRQIVPLERLEKMLPMSFKNW